MADTEVHALLLRKLGRALAREWLLSGALPVMRVLPQEEAQAKVILARRRDNDWSLCDAISFAVLEARGVRTAFTFDRHFRQYERSRFSGLIGRDLMPQPLQGLSRSAGRRSSSSPPRSPCR